MRSLIKLGNKKGNILTENLIFIILNLVFLSILMLFVFSKTGSAAVLEEKYAKQIALMIDASEPLMAISLEMEDAVEAALDAGINPNESVSIEDNIVTIRLQDGRGYSYSFFNDVFASANNNGNTYTFVIEEKEERG